MKLFTSRVVLCTFMSIFACGQIALADIPETDFRTVTSKAYVDSLISEIPDVSGHKVNGIALSNENIYFYATEASGGAASATKTVQLTAGDMDSNATTIPTGMILVIKPAANTTATPTTLKLKKNSSDTNGISKPLRYNGAAITSAMAPVLWRADTPSVWAFDGSNWNYVGGQPLITKSTTSGAVDIVAKPASDGTDGAIRTLTLDTSTLHTANDMFLPSSKLVNTKLGLKLDTANVLNTTASGTSFGGAAIRIPEPLTAWGDVNHKDKLDDGSQLFWVKYAADNGEANNSALTLLTGYSSAKNVPTMDEVASALYGYWETRETTRDWQDVAQYYRVERAESLFRLFDAIKSDDPNAVLMEKSGYLDTYAPTLSALMNESAALMESINSIAQNLNSSINNRQIIIPEAGKYRTSNTAASSTTINNSVNTSPNYTTAAVKGTALVTKTGTAGAVGERKVLDSDTDLRDTTVWPTAKVAVSIPSMGKVNDVAQAKKTCYQSSPTSGKCWLWVLPNDIPDVASASTGRVQ